MVSARVDPEFTKMVIEELKSLEGKSRPHKMDVLSVDAADAFTHEEWVAWMEMQGDEEYEEEAENPSLDAIGGKAKGKGKGKKKGKDDLAKGKGKGRGRDRQQRRLVWIEASLPRLWSCGSHPPCLHGDCRQEGRQWHRRP